MQCWIITYIILILLKWSRFWWFPQLITISSIETVYTIVIVLQAYLFCTLCVSYTYHVKPYVLLIPIKMKPWYYGLGIYEIRNSIASVEHETFKDEFKPFMLYPTVVVRWKLIFSDELMCVPISFYCSSHRRPKWIWRSLLL